MAMPMTEHSAQDIELEDNEIQEKIETILNPLTDKKEFSFEYRRLYKDMLDMNRRFRSVEATFTEAFNQIVHLEEKIANAK